MYGSNPNCSIYRISVLFKYEINLVPEICPNFGRKYEWSVSLGWSASGGHTVMHMAGIWSEYDYLRTIDWTKFCYHRSLDTAFRQHTAGSHGYTNIKQEATAGESIGTHTRRRVGGSYCLYFLESSFYARERPGVIPREVVQWSRWSRSTFAP